MKIERIFLIGLLCFPAITFCQRQDSNTNKLDRLRKNADSLKSEQIANYTLAVYDDAKLDFKTYFTLLADDFKQQITQPFHTSKKDWLKVGGFAAISAGVAFVNKPINRFAVKVRNDSKTVADISRYITDFGGAYEVYTLAGFYAYGLIFKTKKEKTTTALATQAYITAGVLSTAAKLLSGVQRPYYTDPNSGRRGAIFHGPFYPFTSGVDAQSYSSFPSGHTTAAFAAATVYALEYKDKPLIHIISYSAATLIGLSRLTENKHWPTDVLAGAVLGFLSGKQVVDNFHRYSKLKRGTSTRESVTYNLQYFNKQLTSAVIYNF